MEKVMKSKWVTTLSITILFLELLVMLAFSGCLLRACGLGDEDAGDAILRSKSLGLISVAEVGAQAGAGDLKVHELIYSTGIYTPDGYTSVSAQSAPAVPALEEHGYLGIKVPHLSPTCTAQVLSPTAHFAYQTYPTDTTQTFTIPLESRADLASQVESRHPSGSNAHWEVWWSQQGYKWPTPTAPFQNPEAEIIYNLDFCGASPWGHYLEYLLCVGDVCAGPFQERISQMGQGALVDFPPSAYPPPDYGLVVTPGVPFTKTHVLCNYDQITHTYDLAYSSAQNWNYAMPTTIQLGPAPGPWGECKAVELVGSTTATDTVDTVLITATSQLSPAEVYASTWNLVFTPWVTPTITEEGEKPQLSIGKSAPSQVLPGGLLTYTIVVSETSELAGGWATPGQVSGRQTIPPVTGLIVTDTVPANTTCYTPTIGQGGTLITDTVVWSGLTISQGQSLSLTFAVVVGQVPSGAIITNDAYRVVSSTQGVTTGLGRAVNTVVGSGPVYLPTIMKTS